ncbi:BAG family molecular chaperone regulator 4 [Carex littledalei]|uniref:BAG family molecular chaperone regulator 4 n=1 Tax=Carex littledalei TaxID=544730 RepID=A0A833VA80_9POAL|nr:BAG family molecular chaperone regulator 4 [Carex littledalei]
MRRSYTKPSPLEKANRGGVDWEIRPGGMLVQKRSGHCGVGPAAQTIKVLVSQGSYLYEVNVAPQATFGELKRIVAKPSGLEMCEQRILFQGKERENNEFLHIVGVKDASKVVLMEDPASRERKMENIRRDHGMTQASEAVARVRAEVDKLSEKVSILESSMRGDKRIPEKEITVLSELLMVQLLKLDSIEADGEAKAQRRIEVRRVQNHVERLDMLKAINANPFNKTDRSMNRFDLATKWEAFGS